MEIISHLLKGGYYMEEIKQVIQACVSMLQNNSINIGSVHINLFAYSICLCGIVLAGYAIKQTFGSR